MVAFTFWSLTIDFMGKVLLGVTALLVHNRVKKERKIGKQVLKEMRYEQLVGILAILLITVGYILGLKGI